MFIDAEEYVKNNSKERRQQHLDLSDQCWERGGNSTNHRGVLAQYLNTSIPKGRTICAHACNNGQCSNPKHMYWATDYENIVEDGPQDGSRLASPWERSVAKYGYEMACKMNGKTSKQAAKAGAGNKGKPKSEEHKRKIAEAIKRKHEERMAE